MNDMTQKDKYVAFRQFLFNELNITKTDIQGWIKEAVSQEVVRLVNQQSGKFNILENMKKILTDYIFNRVRDPYELTPYDLRKEVIKQVSSDITKHIKISLDNTNNI